MNFKKLLKFDNSHIPKRFSFRDGKKHVYHNVCNRLGDEIFNTALLKFLKQEKNYYFHYFQNCYAINSKDYFPEDLASFEDYNFSFYGLESFDPGCLWLWNQMLREKGYFCELKDKYNEADIKFDVIFIPLIEPEYNPTRSVARDCIIKVFESLLEKFPKTIMLADYQKKNFFNYSHPNFIFSRDLKFTFDLIRKSKFFVGCDTGVSHFAAGIKHPRMVAIYPDYSLLGVDSQAHYINLKNYIKRNFGIKNIFDYNYCALPCCDSKNCKVLLLDNNWVDPESVIDQIKDFQDLKL